MGWRETCEEMGYDNLTSQTRKEEERGREWKTERGRKGEKMSMGEWGLHWDARTQ